LASISPDSINLYNAAAASSSALSINYQGRNYALWDTDLPAAIVENSQLILSGKVNAYCERSMKLLEKENQLKAKLKPSSKSTKILERIDSNARKLLQVSEKKPIDVLLEAIAEQREVFKAISKELKSDKNFVLEALRKNISIYEFIPEEMKADKGFILEAIKIDPEIWHFHEQILNNDDEFILKAMKIIPKALFWATKSAHLMNYPPFLLEAMKINPRILPFISDDLQGNKAFILEAMRVNSHAFFSSKPGLKDDKDFMLVAIDIDSSTFDFASENLKNNSDFLLEAIKIHPDVVSSLPVALRNNKDFMLNAVKINPTTFDLASQELKSNSDFLLQSVSMYGWLLIHMPASLETPEIVNAAHTSLKNNFDFLDKPETFVDLFQFALFIVQNQVALDLPQADLLFQRALDIVNIGNAPDANNPYLWHENLKNFVEQEELLPEFEGFRQRAQVKTYTFADIPVGIISFSNLFASIEQRGISEAELQELCMADPELNAGNYLAVVKENVLGEGREIPKLLAQKEGPLSVTAMYLYLILKDISITNDDRKENGLLSDRENKLLKFASMVKECATGQSDAIEAFYILTLSVNAPTRAEDTIKKAVDHAVQITLRKALASEALLQELTGKEDVLQQSHQTLYLQNRYHRQIGLVHTLKFDRYPHHIDHALIDQDSKEGLRIIKKHLHLTEQVKLNLNQAITQKSIGYQPLIDYFKRELEFEDGQEEQYMEFDEEHNFTLTSVTVEKMLSKLGYTLS
jgi:hypothetical protein